MLVRYRGTKLKASLRSLKTLQSDNGITIIGDKDI